MPVSKRSLLSLIFACALVASATCSQAADIKGKVAVQGLRSAAGIAVYVDTIPGKTFQPPAQHLTMDQVHLAFAPHVMIVLKGSTVDFKNEDPVGHNVYWPAIDRNRKLAHNMGTWPQGQSKPFTFNDLGNVPLLCNVHPEMSGYIIVVPTPYFALTEKDGTYDIRNVPAGQYTLKTWSEEGKPLTQSVTVGASGANVNLTVKR